MTSDLSSYGNKRALQLASVASMIDQFTIPNIEILQSLGYEVDVVADFTNPGTITAERCEDLKQILNSMGVRYFDIHIPRSLNPIKVISSYGKVKSLIENGHYTLLHCHSPIGGVIARQAAKRYREHGLKVIYTAHGFHFYDGAPLKNWLIFYPIEKWYSKFTDVLITINKEDYQRASEHFHAKKTSYIPGVGVDTEKFAMCKVDKSAKRAEIGVKDTDFVLLSVGELSERKNQKVIIDALHTLKEDGSIRNIVYLAVGKGDQEQELRSNIVKYGLEDHVKLLGFRTDIDELCEITDCFVHPSIREGLGIAPLEAMAAGLPLISADINGIKDYTENGVSGCCVDPTDVDAMINAINCMHDDEVFRLTCAANNWKKAKIFDIRNTNEIMKKIYKGGYKHLLSIVIRQQKRSELGIELSDFVLASVGELNENKNHQVVIKSIVNIPNVKYVIVGKGILEKKLRELSRNLGIEDAVIFTGFRTDIRDLLWMSDCFAFPSKREGLGLAAIEAMSAGLPLLTSNIHGIRDYSIPEVTGYSFNVDDVKSIAEKVRLFMDNKLKIYQYSNNCKIIGIEYDLNNTNTVMNRIYGEI